MKTNVVIHRDFSVAAVDPRIYGAHLGRPGGSDHLAIVDPLHPAADEDGLRTDVLDLARAYQLPCMFGADATDRPGARGQWDGDIRVDGLVDWCRRSGAEPMLSLALDAAGGRGLDAGERHGVRMWHLGLAATDFDAADHVLPMLRAGHPGATLVLGAAEAAVDRTLSVLDRHRHALDLVSLPSLPMDATNGLAGSTHMARAIDELSGRLDRAGIADRGGRSIGMQIDQWGAIPASISAADAALDRALTMNLLIRKADRVRTAFARNVLSGIADLLSDRIGMGHRSELYDPLLAGSVYGRGVSLMPAVRGAVTETADGEVVSAVDAAAVHGEENGSLTLFLANRAAEAVTVAVDLHGFSDFALTEYRVAAPGPRMPGTRASAPTGERGRLSWVLPARAYAMVRVQRRHS